ncbi:MAG: hypothetical protein AABX77_03070, partial [Nanoarchaeota archaeon]
MSFFENKNYPTIMFLAISIAVLLIVFNSISIFENKLFESDLNEKIIEKYKVTGLVAEGQYDEESDFIYEDGVYDTATDEEFIEEEYAYEKEAIVEKANEEENQIITE